MMNIYRHCNHCIRCTVNHRYNGINTFSSPSCIQRWRWRRRSTVIYSKQYTSCEQQFANDETPSSTLQPMIPIPSHPNILLFLSTLYNIIDVGGCSTVLVMATLSKTTSTSSIPSYDLWNNDRRNKQHQHQEIIMPKPVAPPSVLVVDDLSLLLDLSLYRWCQVKGARGRRS